MQLTCWGARGSSPISGKEYLKYGGNTACLEFSLNDNAEKIIIDLGSGAIPLGNALQKEKVKRLHIFLSHLHLDHIMGFPLFAPLFAPNRSIIIWENSSFSIQNNLRKLMSPPFFPVPFRDIKAEINFKSFDTHAAIQDVQLSTIPLNHPNQGLGFCLQCKNRKVIFLTDNELHGDHTGNPGYSNFVDFAAQADLLIHDAEFTDLEYAHTRNWGHSSYEQAIQLAKDAEVKELAFFHHNRFRKDPDLDQLVNQYSNSLADDIHCFALAQGQSLAL